MVQLLAVVMLPLLKNVKTFAFMGKYDKEYYGCFLLTK